MSVEVAIICDGCSMHGGAAKTAAAARAGLRQWHGWRVGLPGGRDLCAECAEKEAADTKEQA